MSAYCQACRQGFLRLLELGLSGYASEVATRQGDCHSCGEPSALYVCSVSHKRDEEVAHVQSQAS